MTCMCNRRLNCLSPDREAAHPSFSAGGAPAPAAKAEPATGVAAWGPLRGVYQRAPLGVGLPWRAPAEESPLPAASPAEGEGRLRRAKKSVLRRRNLV